MVAEGCHIIFMVLRANLRKNQTEWELKIFEASTQIYMEVGLYEECSKMSIIEVITNCCHGNTECFLMRTQISTKK